MIVITSGDNFDTREFQKEKNAIATPQAFTLALIINYFSETVALDKGKLRNCKNAPFRCITSLKNKYKRPGSMRLCLYIALLRKFSLYHE